MCPPGSELCGHTTSGSTFGQRAQGFLKAFALFNLRMIMFQIVQKIVGGKEDVVFE